MQSDASVTDWIASLKAEESDAAELLFGRYIERLKALARGKLNPAARRMSDEEDIAVVALHDAFRGIQEGRFARLNDRHDLWQVLVMLVDRRVTDQIRRATSRKRGGGHELGESAFEHGNRSGSRTGGIGQVAGGEPTPEFVAEFVEQFDRRMTQLDDRELQEIATQKMRAYTNAEIAQQRDCTERTVERKLQLIRKIWEAA